MRVNDHAFCDVLTLFPFNRNILASSSGLANGVDLSHLDVGRLNVHVLSADHVFLAHTVETFTGYLVWRDVELLHDVGLPHRRHGRSLAMKRGLGAVAAEQNGVHALHVELLQLGAVEVMRNRLSCLVGVLLVAMGAIDAHKPAERVHRAHRPHHGLAVDGLLLMRVLVILHHLVPIGLPEVARSHNADLLGDHLVQFFVLCLFRQMIHLSSVLLIHLLVGRAESLDARLEAGLVL